MSLVVAPDPNAHNLSQVVEGVDQDGQTTEIATAQEQPLTLYINAHRVVTLMSIGDHPVLLSLGYLFNQGLIDTMDDVVAIKHDRDLQSVAVEIRGEEQLLKKRGKAPVTPGYAQGMVFGDLLDTFQGAALAQGPLFDTAWLTPLMKRISQTPSLYLHAGAIHGCLLCQGDRPLIYMEDIGRHNALDKISGYMLRHDISSEDKAIFTTGRLTSEMVIKCARTGIPVLISRSGFTAMGVDLARQVGLTLIGRAKGRRYIVLAGSQRLINTQSKAG